jgi:hypothetical protein
MGCVHVLSVVGGSTSDPTFNSRSRKAHDLGVYTDMGDALRTHSVPKGLPVTVAEPTGDIFSTEQIVRWSVFFDVRLTCHITGRSVKRLSHLKSEKADI